MIFVHEKIQKIKFTFYGLFLKSNLNIYLNKRKGNENQESNKKNMGSRIIVRKKPGIVVDFKLTFRYHPLKNENAVFLKFSLLIVIATI